MKPKEELRGNSDPVRMRVTAKIQYETHPVHTMYSVLCTDQVTTKYKYPVHDSTSYTSRSKTESNTCSKHHNQRGNKH